MSAPDITVLGHVTLAGVTMRTSDAIATAVRRTSGEIVVRARPFTPLRRRHAALRLPGPRGIAALVDGARSAMAATAFAVAQILGAPLAPASVGFAGETRLTRRRAVGAWLVTLTAAAGLGIVGVVALPYGLATALGHWHAAPPWQELVQRVLLCCGEVAGLAAALGAARRLPRLRRLLGYRGAMHRALEAWRCGIPLEIAGVRRLSRSGGLLPPSLMATSLMLSPLLFAAVLPLQATGADGFLGHLWGLAGKAGLLVALAGPAHEINRYAAHHAHHGLARAMLAPARWLQRLGAHEPDEATLEVALVALKAVLAQSPPRSHRVVPSTLLRYRPLADACARQA